MVERRDPEHRLSLLGKLVVGERGEDGNNHANHPGFLIARVPEYSANVCVGDLFS